MFPKTQDHTIDKLLRAQGGGPGKDLPLCREFDADLANAYVERSLTVAERAGYEQHLAACAPCRKTIVALTRMAQADQVPAHRVVAAGQTDNSSRVRQWLGALTMPQWAMVAAAAVVLAISLPVILSHRATPPSNEVAGVTEDKPAPVASAPNAPAFASAPGGATVASNGREATIQDRGAAEKPTADSEKKEAQAQPAAQPSNANGGAPAVTQPAAPKPADETLAKADTPAQPAGATATEPAQAKTSADTDHAKAKEETKDAAAKPATDKRAEVASEQAGTIAPPPPPPTRTAETERARRDEPATSGPAISSAFRDSTREAVTSPSRKIGGHQFWLRGGVWTDKDYNPDRDKPVTIIRDSEVYRDLIAKDSKIKPFLTYFPVDARVIFKFKGTVYKLIPQDADR